MPFTTFRLIKCNVSISKDFIQLKIDKLEHKISLNNFKIDNLWLDITRHAKRGSGGKRKRGERKEKKMLRMSLWFESCIQNVLVQSLFTKGN